MSATRQSFGDASRSSAQLVTAYFAKGVPPQESLHNSTVIMKQLIVTVFAFSCIGCSARSDKTNVLVRPSDDAVLINKFLDARLDPMKGRLSRTIEGRRAHNEIFDGLVGEEITDYPELFAGRPSKKGSAMLADELALLPGQQDWITGRFEDADCYSFVTDMWEIENVNTCTDLLVIASVDGVIVDWGKFPFFPY